MEYIYGHDEVVALFTAQLIRHAVIAALAPAKQLGWLIPAL